MMYVNNLHKFGMGTLLFQHKETIKLITMSNLEFQLESRAIQQIIMYIIKVCVYIYKIKNVGKNALLCLNMKLNQQQVAASHFKRFIQNAESFSS